MADLGSDFSAIDDVDSNLTPVDGRVAFAQALARRLIAPAGSLFYDPNYGLGLSSFLSTSFDSASQVESAIERECRKDERTKEVKAEVLFDAASEALSARIDVTDGLGPFALTLTVSALTTQVLLENL